MEKKSSGLIGSSEVTEMRMLKVLRVILSLPFVLVGVTILAYLIARTIEDMIECPLAYIIWIGGPALLVALSIVCMLIEEKTDEEEKGGSK